MRETFQIKAISLWEPWASLILTGAKTVETRSYKTNVRGQLLICAAQTKKGIKLAEESGLIQGSTAYSGREICLDISDNEIEMNFGKALAVVNLWDCMPVEEFKIKFPHTYEQQEPYGDYSEGRYAWIFDEIRAIEKISQFYVKGKQGFFNVFMPFHPNDTTLTRLIYEV